MPEERDTKFCSNCGAEIDAKAKICPKCGVKQPIIPEKVSNWWYVFAFFLGIIGGVIAWAVNKDRNPKKSIRFLVVGLILPVISTIGIFASIFLTSLNGAKEQAKETRIMASMNQMRAVAETVYLNEGESYSLVNCSHPKMASLCRDIKTQSGKEPIIHSARKDYCFYTKLPSEGYYCVDSEGNAGKTSIYPGRKGYCDGTTFSCP